MSEYKYSKFNHGDVVELMDEYYHEAQQCILNYLPKDKGGRLMYVMIDQFVQEDWDEARLLFEYLNLNECHFYAFRNDRENFVKNYFE